MGYNLSQKTASLFVGRLKVYKAHVMNILIAIVTRK